MLQKQAKKISRYMINRNIICSDDREVFDYCFEVLLATVLNVSLATVIAVAFHRIYETVLFLLTFAVLRAFAGGFHADTHFFCVLLLIANQMVFITFLFVLPKDFFGAVSILGAILACLVIFVLSPIENKNKLLSTHEKHRNRQISRKITLLYLAVLIVLATFISTRKYSLSISLSMISVASSQLIATTQRISNSNKPYTEVTK